MKTKFLKMFLPISLGLSLAIITLIGLVGCEPVCADNQLAGNNGHCYSCDGSVPSYTYSAGCSSAVAGVYCCPGGGGGGCQPTGCPSTHPWLCGATCYTSPPSGNHACRKCP